MKGNGRICVWIEVMRTCVDQKRDYRKRTVEKNRESKKSYLQGSQKRKSAMSTV